MQHKCIVTVETVIVLTGVFRTFETVLQVVVPDAADCPRTCLRTETVFETPVAVALQAKSAQSAVESAKREEFIRSIEIN
jgi:hypothetical protein